MIWLDYFAKYSSIIIAIFAIAAFTLSFSIFRFSKNRQKEIDELIIAIAASNIMSLRITDPNNAKRLFNDSRKIIMESLKP